MPEEPRLPKNPTAAQRENHLKSLEEFRRNKTLHLQLIVQSNHYLLWKNLPIVSKTKIGSAGRTYKAKET